MATPIPENRAPFPIAEILAATGGAAFDLEPAREVVGVSTDSRTVAPGNLFVALRGTAHDGHVYVAAARARGALPLVARDGGIAGPRVEVDDTLAALGALARAFVERSRAERGARPALAIGGAAGKTTTKTLAAAAVEALFGDTLVTAGNLNNRIGVPLTLLGLAPHHRAIVVECGTSEPGEIAALGAIVRPEVALVVNVGIEHSAGLGTLEEIADEEGALFAWAARAGVTSDAEPLLVERLRRSGAPRQLLFGASVEADVRLVRRSPLADGTTELVFRLGGELAAERPVEARIATPLLGRAAAANVAAALAGALALLGRPAAPSELDAAAAALGAVAPVAGRLAPQRIGELLLLDDSYNANPKSVGAALEAARELAERRGARLVVALGDMLELGALSAAAHEDAIAEAAGSGAALLVLVGPECGRARAQLSFATPCRWYPDSTAAAAAIDGLVRRGDVVLVKGSRGTRMERLIEALEAAEAARAGGATKA